jgi:hypothetical protein
VPGHSHRKLRLLGPGLIATALFGAACGGGGPKSATTKTAPAALAPAGVRVHPFMRGALRVVAQ